jgi:hypothetical protein
MAMPSTDSDELAKFGYKQELDRSPGLFSSFAAGFSYISIMTPAASAIARVHGRSKTPLIPSVVIGFLRGRPASVLAEHRAGGEPAGVTAAGEVA